MIMSYLYDNKIALNDYLPKVSLIKKKPIDKIRIID